MTDALLVSDSGLRDLSEQAIRYMVDQLGAERAVVLIDEGEPEFTVTATMGLNKEGFWLTAPLSVTVLEKVIESGEATVTTDAQRDHGDLFSLQVSQIKSLVCVPLFRTVPGKGRTVAGLLYADLRLSKHVFKRTELENLKQFAKRFQTVVFEDPDSDLVAAPKARAGAAKVPEFKRAPIPKSPKPTRPKVQALEAPAGGRISRLHKAVYFRGLCTLIGAGISIPQALSSLVEGAENENLAQASQFAADAVSEGQRLSVAFERCPWAFNQFQVRMLRVGESTGALPRVLERLAKHEESSSAMEQKLRSALTYPLLIGAFSLLLLLLGPPFVLQPQFEMIRQLGGEPPMITRVLMTLTGPTSLVIVGIFFALVYGLWRRWQHKAHRASIYRKLMRLPAVGRVLEISSLCNFSRSLALQLESGVLLSQALPLAAEVSGNPLIEEQIGDATRALLDGETFADSLQQVEFFPKAFLQIVEIGEESAALPELLSWLSGFFDKELEASLEAYASLFEPLMLLFVGTIVGLLCLGTLLPVIRVLQSAL